MTSVNPINFVLNITGASSVTHEFAAMAAAVDGFGASLTSAQKLTKGAFTTMVRDATKFSVSISKAFAGYTAGSKNAVRSMEALAKRVATLEAKITRTEETEIVKRDRLRKVSLQKRLASQAAFYAKLNALAATSAQAITRGIASVGSLGPAIKQSLNAVSSTIKKAGVQSGTSFVGSLVKSITTGLASIPRLISGVIGPIISSIGNMFRAISSSIIPLAVALGPLIASGLVAAFAATGPVALAIGAIVPLIVVAMAAAASAAAAGFGSILTIAGGFVSGLGEVLSSVTSVVGSVVAKVADALTAIVNTAFSVISGLVQSTVGTVIDTISGIAGKLGGIAKGIADTILGPVGLIIAGLSTKAAADINDKLIDAFALLDNRSEFHLGNTRDRVFELSRALGVASNEIAGQFFDVVSAGFRTQDEAFEILQRSSELAVAGRASVQEAGEAIVTILKTQKRGYEEAGQVAQALFVIQDRGRLTIGDAARAFSKFGGVITGAKVPIEDLGAALAVLSQQGLGVNEEANQLRRLIEQLAVPTRDTRKAMAAWGVTLHEVSSEERAHLDLLEQRLDAEVSYLAELEKGTPAYKTQIKLIEEMDNKVGAAIRTRGEWVGYRESIDRLNDAFKKSGKSALAFATEFTSRIRAKQGLAVQLELYDELIEKQQQFTDDAGKFGRALDDSQAKVGVQITKLVESFRQLGVEIFDLGQGIAGGDAFGLISSAVDAVRSKVLALQTVVPSIVEVFEDTGRAILLAFKPLTEGTLTASAIKTSNQIAAVFGVSTDAMAGHFTKVAGAASKSWRFIKNEGVDAFGAVLAAVAEISSVISGSTEFQSTAVSKLLDVVVTGSKLAFNRIKGKFLEIRDTAIGDMRAALVTVVQMLTSVVAAMGTTVGRILSLTPSGQGLVMTLLTGGGNVAARVREVVALAKAELAILSDEAVLATGSVIEDFTKSAVAGQLSASRQRVAELQQDLVAAFNESGKAFQIGALDMAGNGIVGLSRLIKHSLVGIIDDANVTKVGKELVAATTLQIGLQIKHNTLKKQNVENQKALLVATKATTDLDKELSDELDVRLEVLNESYAALVTQGIELRRQAGLASEAAAEERIRSRLIKEGVEDVKAILRVEIRRKDLAKDLKLTTEAEKKQLKEILDAFDTINRSTDKGQRSTELLANEFERLVELSGKAGVNVEELVSILNEVQFSIGPASGIGGLKRATGGGLTAPGGDPEGLGLEDNRFAKALSPIDESLINGFDFVGSALSGLGTTLQLGTPTSDIGGAAGKHLKELAQGTVFERAIANAFKQMGQARGGVGGFVGAGNKAKGEGFIPFEDFPLELIGEFREQLEAGIPAESLKLSTELFRQAVDDMLFAQRTGDSPGPRLSRATGFEVSGGGKVKGITPEAVGTQLGQAVLESLAGRQAVDDFLESNGLTHKALGEIKRLMETRNEELRKATRNAAGKEAFVSGGVGIGLGKSKVSSVDTKALVKAQQDVLDGQDGLTQASIKLADALAVELAAKEDFEASKARFGESGGNREMRRFQDAEEASKAAALAETAANSALGASTSSLTDIMDGGSDASLRASEAMGGLVAALDTLEAVGGNAGELLASGGLGDALRGLDIDKDITDLVRAAERKGADSAEGALVKTATEQTEKGKAAAAKGKKVKIEIDGFTEEERKVATEVAKEAKSVMEEKAKGFSEVMKSVGDSTKGMKESFSNMAAEIRAFAESIRTAFELMTDELTEVITEMGDFAADVADMGDTVLSVMSDFRVELDALDVRVQANTEAIAGLSKGGP